MRRLSLILIVVLLVGFIDTQLSLASVAPKSDAKIAVVNKQEKYSKVFSTTVQVLFINNALYNEKVHLSYHVYNSKGDLLLFEGERLPLNFISDNLYYATFNVDLEKLKTREKNLTVQFDLVDQSKSFWFSTNSNVILESDQIISESNFSDNIFIKEIFEHKLVAIMNIVVLISLLALWLIYRKKF